MYRSRYPSPNMLEPSKAVALCYLRMIEYGKMGHTFGSIPIPLHLLKSIGEINAAYPIGYNYPDWKVQSYIGLLPSIIWEARAVRNAAYSTGIKYGRTVGETVSKLVGKFRLRSPSPIDTVLRFNELFGLFNIFKPTDDITTISDCRIGITQRRHYYSTEWPNRIIVAAPPKPTIDLSELGRTTHRKGLLTVPIGDSQVSRAYRKLYEGVESSYMPDSSHFKPLESMYSLLPISIAEDYTMRVSPDSVIRDVVREENILRIDKWKYITVCEKHSAWHIAKSTPWWANIELE